MAEAFNEYAEEIAQSLRDDLYRVEVDASDNSFNKKVREAVTNKIPNILIVGGKEAEAGTVTLRRYCVKEQVSLTRKELAERFSRLVSDRIMDNFADVEVG